MNNSATHSLCAPASNTHWDIAANIIERQNHRSHIIVYSNHSAGDNHTDIVLDSSVVVGRVHHQVGYAVLRSAVSPRIGADGHPEVTVDTI